MRSPGDHLGEERCDSNWFYHPARWDSSPQPPEFRNFVGLISKSCC
jgi:hypothetical protein